jgi:hypothetical protein
MVLFWSILVMATIWIDGWFVSFLFSFISCALGVITLTASSTAVEKERKESRGVGLVLVIVGVVLAILEVGDQFITGRL